MRDGGSIVPVSVGAAPMSTAARSTPTVRDAADRWLVAVELGTRRAATERVEPSTLRQYTYHVRQYIEPELGDMRLGELTEERVRKFCDQLLGKLSRAMAVKVVGTLKAILIEERYGGEALDVTFGKASKRHKTPVAIPSPSEIRASVLGDGGEAAVPVR